MSILLIIVVGVLGVETKEAVLGLLVVLGGGGEDAATAML